MKRYRGSIIAVLVEAVQNVGLRGAFRIISLLPPRPNANFNHHTMLRH